MSWRDRAECRNADPELFFPVGTTGPAIHQLKQAKLICGGCGVRAECLQWAIDASVDYGVFGGLSEDERRSMKRRSARLRRSA
jgi:WhiB family redox-sensing transcriptional regulator